MQTNKTIQIGAAFAALFAGAAWSEAPQLAFPLDCIYGATCHIQQYVDRDPTQGVRDVACGDLSYDGHQGTDFALPSMQAMRDGVDVLAAADGTVQAVRDGMVDKLYSDDMAEDINGRDCGNGAVISHGDGWVTQYCHLKQGSLQVKTGSQTKQGEVIGQVGLSGRTQFPHLHLTVRQDGKVVDPFVPDMTQACGTEKNNNMWNSAVVQYLGAGLIASGFTDAPPSYEQIKDGTLPELEANTSTEALIFWVYAYGTRAGDTVRMRMNGPNGVILEEGFVQTRDQAQMMQFFGKRMPDGGWPKGHYSGFATIERGQTKFGSHLHTFTIE